MVNNTWWYNVRKGEACFVEHDRPLFLLIEDEYEANHIAHSDPVITRGYATMIDGKAVWMVNEYDTDDYFPLTETSMLTVAAFRYQ